MPIIGWNSPVVVEVAESETALWQMGTEIQKSPCLLNMRLGVRLESTYHIWKLDIPFQSKLISSLVMQKNKRKTKKSNNSNDFIPGGHHE